MTSVEFASFAVPLGYVPAEVVLPDGLDVVGAEVVEADLVVRLHYVADSGVAVMRRRVQAAPQGVKMSGARHLYTVMRLGVAYHYCIEE